MATLNQELHARSFSGFAVCAGHCSIKPDSGACGLWQLPRPRRREPAFPANGAAAAQSSVLRL